MSKELEWLRLSQCKMEDGGAILVCGRLVGMHMLVEIDLSNNKLTCASLENGFAKL